MVAIIIVLALCTVGVLLLVGSMNPDWFGNASGSSETNTQVSVDQDAQPLLQATQGYTWTLTKTATPDFLLLAPGENADVTYTITATRTAVESDSVMAVKGSIHVMNVGNAQTKNLMITDIVQANDGNGFVDIASVAVDTSKKPVLAAGEDYWYPFTVYFKNVEGATYQNIERVSISNLADRTGQSLAAEAVLDVKAAATPLQIAGEDANATVTDAWTTPSGWVTSPSAAGPWYFSESGSVEYTVKVSNVFASFYTEAYLKNTATLTGSDSGETVMADETVVLSTNFHPGIKIVKSAPDCVTRGEPITYTFTVYNFGDALVNNVTVLDPMFPDSLNYYIGDMVAGSEETFQVELPTDESTASMLVNTATVHGFFVCMPISNSSSTSVMVIDPSISIEKTAPECLMGGATFEWMFNVTNTGDVELLNVMFSDGLLGINENLGNLAPGASLVFTKPGTAPMSGSVLNEASVTASTECGISVEDDDDATVNVVNPSMTFVKGGPDCVRIGDDIIWTFSIKNTGDVELTNLMMVDPPADVSVPLASLAPGAYWNFTYTTTPAETGSVYNYAYVTANAPCGYQLNETDDHSVIVINPSIELIKGGPTDKVPAGSEFTWTFRIENTGDSNLIEVMFTDLNLSDARTYTANGGVFVPGAIWEFTIPDTAPGQPGKVWNDASVTAKSQCGSVTDISDSSAWVVDIILNTPGIEITKDGPDCVQVGSKITWNFSVHNIGDVNFTDVMFYDPMLGIVSGEQGPNLLVGQYWNFTKIQNANAVGVFTNVATVTAESDSGQGQFSATDSADFSVVNPKISIQKGGPDNVEPGADIVWTFSIMNTGDTPLSNVVFNDPPVGVTLNYTDNGGVLAVGAKWEFTYITVAPESGDVDNFAYVTAIGGCDIQVRDDDDHTVEVESPCDCDCLLVTKTGTTEAIPGGKVVWQYSIYNCAYPGELSAMTNLWLHDEITLGDGSVVAIFDSYSGEIIPCAVGTPMVPWILPPGQWFNFTVKFEIPSDWTYCEDGEWMNNTFKVQACCAGGFARGEDSWSTHITDSCSIKVEKFSNVDEAAPGDEIQYSIRITNTGMNRLVGLKVWESLENMEIDLQCDLDPCETIWYNFTYTVPSDWNWCDDPRVLLNEVKACAYCVECDAWVEGSDCNSVGIVYPPQIEVTKTANVSEAWANPMYGNNQITWTITVRNVGPYPITCVEVKDEQLGFYETIQCLMPCCYDITSNSAIVPPDGDGGCTDWDCGVNSMTWTIVQTVPSDWSYCEDGEWLVNEVTASGWACGHAVSDSASDSVYINDPYHLEIVKIAPEVVYQGQEITYTIMVANAGSKVLSYIDVFDDVDKDGVIDWKTTIECLEPCTAQWFNFTYVVPQECCKKDYKLCNYVYANAWVRDVKVAADAYAYSWVMCPCSLDIDIVAQEGASPGETVEFTVTVTNDGNITLVQMDVYAKIKSCECSDWKEYKLGCIVYLEPGMWKEFTFNYTIPTCEQCCHDGYWLKYSANVRGECGCSEKHIWDCEADYLWVRACCAIDVEKTGPSSAIPGQTIEYTITVTNPGINPLVAVKVSDPMLNFYQEIDTLMPGQFMSWTVPYTVPMDWNYCEDKDWLYNTVEAKGLCCDCMICGEKVSWATDSDTISVYIDDPITLVVDKYRIESIPSDGAEAIRCPDIDSRPKPGDMVYYKIVVSNKGYAPLSCIEVSDDLTGFTECIACLLPCTQEVFYVSYMIPWDWTYCEDGEYLVNTATASGWGCDVAVTASDTETIAVNADHIVEVVKSGPSEAVPGQTITYEIGVYNGGKQPLFSLKVADFISNVWMDNVPLRTFGSMLDFREIDCLEPCEWYNFTVTYTVPEDWTCMNGEWLFNWVTVDGKACWPCESLRDCDLVWTRIVDIEPSIEVEKYGPEVAVPGEMVYYNIVVTNPNCYALGCVEVVDETLGFYYVIPAMLPFETMVFSVPLIVPADWSYCEDGEYINNTVEASAWACMNRVSDSAEHTLMVWDPMDLRISKTSDMPDGVMPGETITYTITVWNAGSKVLSSVMIVDEMLNFCETIECLMPCDSKTYTVTYTVPQNWTLCDDGEYINNTVVAWALGCPICQTGMDMAMDDVSVKVIGIDEGIKVWKELTKNGRPIPDDFEINPGYPLEWTIYVMNTGRITLSCVNVTDILTWCNGAQLVLYDDTLTCCLAPCETMKLVVKFIVPAECCGDFMLCNDVTATAWAEDVFVSDSFQKCRLIEGNCDIEISKTPMKQEYWSDEPIVWRITVKNTGKNALACINVTDSLFPGGYHLFPKGLAPGESVSIDVTDNSMPVPCNGTAQYVYNEASVTANCELCSAKDCCIVSDSVVGQVWVKPVFALDIMIKVAEPDCCYEPGDEVRFGVAVRNIGKYPVHGFVLSDELMQKNIVVTKTLNPGETWGPQIFTYVIPEDWTYCDDGKYLEDCWWVEACEICPDVGPVLIMDSECFSLEVCGPQLIMTKDAYVDGELATEVYPGDVVTYEITVKNVGEHSVSCITIYDTVMIGMTSVYFQSEQICCLESCTEFVWTFEFTVPEWYCVYGDNLTDLAVAWGIVNDVQCCYEQGCGYNPYMELAWAWNSLFVHNEFHLEVWKFNNFDSKAAQPGDIIYYEIWVANAGTEAVTNVYVDDDMIGLHEKIDCLPTCKDCDNVETFGQMPCNFVVFRGSYHIPSDWSYCDDGNVVVNTVTVKGWLCSASQTVSDTNYVYVSDPCDVRIYLDYQETAKSGETVTVTVTVKNEGSSMAYGLKVRDRTLGLDEMIWCLAPCESVTFTKTVVIPPCDGVTHYVNGCVKIAGCCDGWDSPWMPNGAQELSQMPKTCYVHEESCWSIMIVCGCCVGEIVPA